MIVAKLTKKQRQQQKAKKELKRREKRRITQLQKQREEVAEQPADEWEELDGSDEDADWDEEDVAAVTTLPNTTESESDAQVREQIDHWWDEFEAGDHDAREKLVRTLLTTIQPGDAWSTQVLDDAIVELHGSLPSARFVQFLEGMRSSRPDLFALELGWNTWHLIFAYVTSEQTDKLDQLLESFARELRKIDEPFFGLFSLIRLFGRAEQAMITMRAAREAVSRSALFPDAAMEMREWEMFHFREECRQAGMTDEAMNAAIDHSIRLYEDDDTEDNRSRHREVLGHFCGKPERPWTRQELLVAGQRGSWRTHLLLFDFMRWLCDTRSVPPIVADELRMILQFVMYRMNAQAKDLLRHLHRNTFDSVLASQLHLLSLTKFQAPASVIAMKHFYEFLAESKWVDARTLRSAQSTCDTLWQLLGTSLENQWNDFKFLEQYWPT